jgi:hypothetical protein
MQRNIAFGAGLLLLLLAREPALELLDLRL